jgi:hypothetical protein
MDMARSKHVEKRNACRVSVAKPEGKRSLGKPRSNWKNNIKINLREKGWGGMDWIHLAEDREEWRALVNTVMDLRVSTKCWEILEWMSNS